jgi:galactonate dehydratase
VDLLIDAHRRLAPNQAIALARRLEQFDIMQFEDPNLADNIELVAETRRAIRQPVVTGETLFTKEHFARVFATGAADIINPDICAVGGILPMLEFAAMAEPYGVAISPHNNNSTVVGLAATLQVSAVVPNFLITEYFVNLEAPSLEFGIRSPVVEDGYIELPTSPGLGVDVNVQALEARPYEAFARTNFRHPEEEFPRRGLV